MLSISNYPFSLFSLKRHCCNTPIKLEEENEARAKSKLYQTPDRLSRNREIYATSLASPVRPSLTGYCANFSAYPLKHENTNVSLCKSFDSLLFFR